MSQFEALGVKLVALSIDHRFAQKAFATKLNLQFPCVEDPNRTISRTLGMLLPEVAGIHEVNRRGVLVINKSGVVQWRFGVDAATQPDLDQVLAAVQAVVQA